MIITARMTLQLNLWFFLHQDPQYNFAIQEGGATSKENAYFAYLNFGFKITLTLLPVNIVNTATVN